jgi:hypothetical protein
VSASLRPHPNQPAAPAIAVEAHATRSSADRLELRYVVTGAVGELLIPPLADPARVDELWKHTCFEAFLRPDEGDAYVELNFAPSRQWAAYGFDGYRAGMRTADEIAPTEIEVRTAGQRFDLSVQLRTSGWLDGRAWRVGLSAVIEALNGEKSYWALAHPPEKPDFHHPDSFALDLLPAEPA